MPRVVIQKPSAVAAPTKAQLSPGFITYNQTGISYNELGYSYGGAYDYVAVPKISLAKSIYPLAFARPTNAQISTGFTTYNQSGISYNELGYSYGGVTGYAIAPLMSNAKKLYPRIVLNGSINPPLIPPPAANSGMLIGMLGITYP